AQTMAPAKSSGASTKVPYYIDLTVMNLPALIPNPPAEGSAVQKSELAVLHRIESSRTQQDVAAAKADEAEEDLFLYKSVLGDKFNANTLPVTAELDAHVRNEERTAGAAPKS